MEMGGWYRGEDEARKTWKDYFEDLYNIDTQDEVAVQMPDFDSIWRGTISEELWLR